MNPTPRSRVAHVARSLARMLWVPLPHVAQPKGAHQPTGGYTVTLRPGEVDMGGFVIHYKIPTDAPNVVLWSPKSGRRVHVTVVKADSGTGKSTLLLQLYRSIRDRLSSPLGFDFDPDMTVPEDVAIAFLPQKAPIVGHWKVRDLVPDNSDFARQLLTEYTGSSLLSMRVGQLSGGQCMRIYVSSALERLSGSLAHAAFLLLDETLDGVGEEQEVTACVAAIAAVWERQSPQKPLHLMLASHKQLGKGGLSIPGSISLGMDVHSRKGAALEVHMQNLENW